MDEFEVFDRKVFSIEDQKNKNMMEDVKKRIESYVSTMPRSDRISIMYGLIETAYKIDAGFAADVCMEVAFQYGLTEEDGCGLDSCPECGSTKTEVDE